MNPNARRLFAIGVVVALSGCERDDELERTTFYSREIAPTLVQSCSASPTRSGCHQIADDRGNALGNLSVESFELVSRRRDLLVDYGPYGVPGLLLKVVPDYQLSLSSWDGSRIQITTDIAHAGDQLVDFTSPAFTTLETWIRNGAAENNARTDARIVPEPGCATELGRDPAFDPAVDPASPDFARFRGDVSALLGERCSASNCHGSPANSLYLTCGNTPELTRWNYFAAADYVSADPVASEILQRVLDPAAGGTYHEGGAIFSSADDAGYRVLLDWATQKGGPTVPPEPGFEFFATRVQPMLVKRGCMMLGCHSAAMFHDYRLRGGSGGHFGLPATRKNYELSLEQLALESPNPTASRILRKNLPPSAGGILHRGGPLFAGATSGACDAVAAESGPLDEQSPFCVISAWIARERAARMGAAAPLSGVVYVRRTPKPGLDAPQDWADFAPGSDVVRVGATLDAAGALTLGAETSLSRACGLDPATSEARRPAVSWDGLRVAFAARAGAAEPFRVYVSDGATCALDAAIAAAPVDDSGARVESNGELVHDFDPTFAPDGRIVFVSTRGNVTNAGGFSYRGPQRTPADPSKLNTNLYVRELDGSIRQLTFLLNQELLPSFMRDGRVILSTEKRAPGFYQLAGRRINIDGGDYHPLFAQRPSIGFTQFTDVVELADRNFAAILSDRGAAHGAGTLAIVNRSIGIDQASPDPSDYPVDPEALSKINEDFYQHSLRPLDAAATGRLDATQGAYATPSALPDGRLLVSYAANVVNLGQFAGDFDVVVVDPTSGQRTPLLEAAEDELWPVAVYARQNLGVFESRPDEPNGATRIDPSQSDRSEITFMDLPLLTTLLFQNTRTGRLFPSERTRVEIWESLPPEPGVTSFATGGAFVMDDAYGSQYVRRALLGAIEPFSDDSAKVTIPGGVPIVLATQAALDGEPSRLRFQREEMQFYPGEIAHQSFKRRLFDGLCGGCHGSLTGQESEIAVNPDILTQASDVQARREPGANLLGATRGAPEGPERFR